MKYAIQLFAVLALTLFASCSSKEKAESSNEWPAMDTFHDVMANAYHPLKDSANLAPAKSTAEAMANEAAKWADSELPSKVDNDAMKGKLAELKLDSRAFADKVAAGASDEELSTALEQLHEKFHGIVEMWYKKE